MSSIGSARIGAERNGSGRILATRSRIEKNDPAAMNRPKHMRQRCRLSFAAPRGAPNRMMRRSPTKASAQIVAKKNSIAAGTPLIMKCGCPMAGGVRAMGRPHFMINGVPAAMLFFLATICALAFVGDLRIIRFGAPRGAAKLRRHLWRMCFGLFIAAGSFFSIRERVAKILPEPFLSAPMRALPILLIFLVMFYWLWRLRTG